ncbi:LD-carboxypeptidase [Rubrivivax albus]|uniref:LD-carboxypeptidase n=1 Tax=Rubrivivax albus TaxID=2499835 RepID=A0A437JLU5_9BURK|nr:LD-carboxypeptidase [Rubrivivax albus]RVT47700.1 LD-carboxypeptidase [Rubrivivax albus]
MKLIIFSPAGVVLKAPPLRLACRRLQALGFDAVLDESALARHQRFAGDDDTRLAALHRVAEDAPSVAMAARGGYGLMRLLDRIDWPLMARSVERGTRWVGYSDLTCLQMGLLAHAKQPSWAGPLAADDFGRADDAGGVDEITRDVFCEAMGGELEAIGFRTDAGRDGLAVRGTLWGGNLATLCSLLGTPHFPRVRGGVLYIEEVNEHPYRVERCLLQLLQAGVLSAQKAVLVGAVSAWKPAPTDRGYSLAKALAAVQSRTKVPLLTGLPFGHVPTKVCLPLGRRVDLVVEGRQALLAWGHGR